MPTKLEHIISTLTDKDIQNFTSLIQSPLLGGREKHVQFFGQFVKSRQGRSLPVNERLLMSDLCKMLEKYIVIKMVMNDKDKHPSILSKYYAQNENIKLFNDSAGQWGKNLHQKNKNSDYYQSASDLEYEKWKFDQLKSRFSNVEANSIIIHSEIALISKKLAEAVSLAPQSVLISKKINIDLIYFLEDYIIQKNYLQYPCISLYYYALKMIFEPQSTQWFEKFKAGLEHADDIFQEEELKTLYFQAINYCIRKHNSGDKSYSHMLLSYYKAALKKGYLLTHGYLSKNTYRNINTIAIRLGLYDDAMEISESCRAYLRKEEQESAFMYNMANIFYATKKYDEALEALRSTEFDDHLSNLTAKLLMLKIYYETGETRILDSHLDAMQVYLTRKKIIGYHKTVFSNIVKYTKKLILLNPYDTTEKNKLKKMISEEKSVADKDWILHQLDLIH